MSPFPRIALIAVVLVACKREPESSESSPAREKTASKSNVTKAPAASDDEPSGPRYLRANNKGELVDAFQFPSVPASIVEQEVANASSRADAAGVLRRFGLAAFEGKAGHVWIAKASLVDRKGRERVLHVSFVGEPAADGLREENGWLVFLGSTEDDRVLKIGNAQLKMRTLLDAPAEVDARELHSSDRDDVVATWSSCAKPTQKACHTLRAWTMQRGYPEMIVDVTGDTPPVISGAISTPHEVVVDGRTLKFDAQAFAYRSNRAVPTPFAELPIHAFKTPRAFETWLAKNHGKVPAIAIRMGKKGSGIASINYKEALDVALCYGWIDGQSKSEGAETFLQRFGKRAARSLWSKINREHVARLVAEGRMQPAGLEEVERAKRDGRWDAAYSSPSAAVVPPELEAALAKNKRARAFFETLDRMNRYAIIHRLETAKRADTRARRVEQFVEMLAEGRRP